MPASRDSWPFYLPAEIPDGNPHPVESISRKPYQWYGKLFDITPFGDQSARPYVRFIPHAGDDLSFFEIKARGHSFTCPPDLTANVSLEDWRPIDDEDANPGGEYFDDMLDRDR